jgi:hypothetical protein
MVIAPPTRLLLTIINHKLTMVPSHGSQPIFRTDSDGDLPALPDGKVLMVFSYVLLVGGDWNHGI